ncbi:hypothetical protein ACH4T9_12920 [Micromonospora sp. NPDC020750]|uniref:hypothetical protein n=1 Tax=unclassified Micromonospora TaxID=2617518 RepID=UPI00378F2ED0
MSADTPSDDTARPDWVGQRAIAWVIDDAPVPADLAWTLIVIARRCGKDGKGSRQNTKTIAAKAGKSVKQAQREIVRLRELGLIVLGDQSLVAHLPPGQRPTVYDVPLHLKGPKPQKESRNKSGLRKGEDSDTPPIDGTPPLEGTPTLEGGTTPPLEGESTPPLEGSQKKPLNDPLNNPSSLSARTPVPPPRDPADDRERDDSTSSADPKPNHDLRHQLVIKHGSPAHLAEQVVQVIEAENPGIRGLGWWTSLDERNHLAHHVQQALAALAACTNCAGKGEVWSEMYSTTVRCGSCPRPTVARDYQGHSSERGLAKRVNVPEGTHMAGWARRKSAEAEKAAGWLTLDTGQEDPWNAEQPAILDHEPEPTR